MSFGERLREIREGFAPAFWVANVTELFERQAYYSVQAVLALYLHEMLRFSDAQAGDLIGYFGGIVWFLPIFGGALADLFGFRRALSFAYLALSAGYFLLGSLGATWMAPLAHTMPLGRLVVLILIVPALGPAIVKPCVVGTTARASTENVRSIGYSIYYTLVNVGGALGPLSASLIHKHFGVTPVFRVAAALMFVTMLAVIIFFREPRQASEVRTGQPRRIGSQFLHRRHECAIRDVPRNCFRLLRRLLAAVHRAAVVSASVCESSRRRRTHSGDRRDRV